MKCIHSSNCDALAIDVSSVGCETSDERCGDPRVEYKFVYARKQEKLVGILKNIRMRGGKLRF